MKKQNVWSAFGLAATLLSMPTVSAGPSQFSLAAYGDSSRSPRSSFCPGASIRAVGTVTGGKFHLEWFDGDNRSIRRSLSSSTSPITDTWTPPSSGRWTVLLVRDSDSHMLAASSLQVLPRVTASLSGSTTVCEFTPATLVVNLDGTGPVSGELSDGTPFSGTAPGIVEVSVMPQGTTTYAIANLSGNCGAEAAAVEGQATVFVNTPPTIHTPPSISKKSDVLDFTGTVSGSPTPEVSYSPSLDGQVAPGTYTVVVTAENSCGVTTAAVDVEVENHAPVWGELNPQTVTICSKLSVPLVASDVDAGQTLKYSIASTPLRGMAINSGVFEWTPGAVGTYQITLRVMDDATPSLYSDKVLTVTVVGN